MKPKLTKESSCYVKVGTHEVVVAKILITYSPVIVMSLYAEKALDSASMIIAEHVVKTLNKGTDA